MIFLKLNLESIHSRLSGLLVDACGEARAGHPPDVILIRKDNSYSSFSLRGTDSALMSPSCVESAGTVLQVRCHS